MVKYNDEYLETANDLLNYYIDNLLNPTLDIRFKYLNKEAGMQLMMILLKKKKLIQLKEMLINDSK